MPDLRRLLIVEDTPSLARTYQAHLRHDFSQIEIADTGAKAISAVDAEPPNCILLDLKLPDANGLELLDRWTNASINCPIVVITANGSMSVAVDAMRRGAVDFVVKPTTKDRLRITTQNAIENFQLREVIASPQHGAVTERSDFCGIIGRSLVMQGVFKSIEAAAPSKASVFVTGETGTGKELIARAVHDLSPRRKAKFVAINCGAIPENLLESELFGHVKGAFTGAVENRIGAAKAADGGTLFLDEICEMDLKLQVKLLRFLQTGMIQRVGSSTAEPVNVRIVCATNRDPEREVAEGRFREDLYYRLNVIPIALPSLRDRGEDIALIANTLAHRIATNSVGLLI